MLFEGGKKKQYQPHQKKTRRKRGIYTRKKSVQFRTCLKLLKGRQHRQGGCREKKGDSKGKREGVEAGPENHAGDWELIGKEKKIRMLGGGGTWERGEKEIGRSLLKPSENRRDLNASEREASDQVSRKD